MYALYVCLMCMPYMRQKKLKSRACPPHMSRIPLSLSPSRPPARCLLLRGGGGGERERERMILLGNNGEGRTGTVTDALALCMDNRRRRRRRKRERESVCVCVCIRKRRDRHAGIVHGQQETNEKRPSLRKSINSNAVLPTRSKLSLQAGARKGGRRAWYSSVSTLALLPPLARTLSEITQAHAAVDEVKKRTEERRRRSWVGL